MSRAAWLRNSLFAFAAAILFGCGGTNSTNSPWYQSPPGLAAADGATVSMSQNQAGGTVPDGDTRVVAVDGETVSPMEWDKIVLPPGRHTLGVQYNGTAAVATVRIQADLKAGASYAVKGERTGPCDAALWLAPQGPDQAQTAKIETHLMAKPSRNGYSVMAVVCN